MKKLTKLLENLPQRRGRQRRRGKERQKEERKIEMGWENRGKEKLDP